MAVNPAKFVSTRVAKEKFTMINRLVAEEKDMAIITKRGKPTTVLISMDKLKELISDEKFNLISGKEKTVPLEELKKELGW